MQKYNKVPSPYILILIFAFCLLPSAFALNAQSFNTRIYNAYLSGATSDWGKILDDYQDNVKNERDRYDFALACYGYLGYLVGQNDKDAAIPYLEHAEVIMDALLDRFPKEPRYLALRAGLYGFRIFYQPHKMSTLLIKGKKLMELAMIEGPDCPEVIVAAGNREWFTPAYLGGSHIEGLADFEKAIRIMEKNPEYTVGSWYYLKVYKLLIERYEQVNMKYNALVTCEKLLEIEPDFKWAKDKLADLKTHFSGKGI